MPITISGARVGEQEEMKNEELTEQTTTVCFADNRQQSEEVNMITNEEKIKKTDGATKRRKNKDRIQALEALRKVTELEVRVITFIQRWKKLQALQALLV